MSTEMTFRPDFGRYLLLKRIAKGGMAEIFRAMSYGAKGFSKLVVIKRMLPHLSRDKDYMEMFINEANLASQLNHANIVHMYDFGSIDELLFHCMEYVHGRNIDEIVQALRNQRKPVRFDAICYIFKEVLYGLDHAHRRKDSTGEPLNIIHRDMSASNIIVSYDGQVKIADFGIAKANPTTIRTVAGVIKGKTRFMSPEQATGRELDQRTDLFSVGICLYEMLTLQPPYPAQEGPALLEKVRLAQFKPPRLVNPNIPITLEAILLKALQLNPGKRYRSAADFRDAIEQFMFDSNMRFSSADLNDYMNELFASAIEAERQALADEIQTAQRSRSAEFSFSDSFSQEATSADAMETQVDLPMPTDLSDTGERTDPADTEVTQQVPLSQLRLASQGSGLSMADEVEARLQGIDADPALLQNHPTPLAIPRVTEPAPQPVRKRFSLEQHPTVLVDEEALNAPDSQPPVASDRHKTVVDGDEPGDDNLETERGDLASMLARDRRMQQEEESIPLGRRKTMPVLPAVGGPSNAGMNADPPATGNASRKNRLKRTTAPSEGPPRGAREGKKSPKDG